MPPALLLAALLLSALAAAVLSSLVIAGGPIDIPRDRGSHSKPTPTSGGLAIMAATGLGIGVAAWFCGPAIPGGWRDGALLFGFAALMGLSGALDDLFDLPPKLRLGFQVGLCLLFAFFYRVTTLDFGPGLILHLPWFVGVLGSAAWLVLGINTLNFMDGANGLAPGTQTIALLVLAGLILLLALVSLSGGFLGGILVICVCAAGAHLGFTPFNLPMGKAFQGDAGALFGGALITGTTLVIKAYGVGSVWFGGFLLAPLLVDVVLTLITRALQGRDLMRPHKDHLYQLWLQRRDPSHGRLALRVWFLCALSSAVGVGARVIDHIYHSDVRFFCLVVVFLVYSFGWGHIRKRLLDMAPIAAVKPGRAEDDDTVIASKIP
ncbi:MAG: glycosyl transferase family 4 family protein [Asticcacaulis sp.]